MHLNGVSIHHHLLDTETFHTPTTTVLSQRFFGTNHFSRPDGEGGLMKTFFSFVICVSRYPDAAPAGLGRPFACEISEALMHDEDEDRDDGGK
jgi:hypothetical protein